MKTQTERAIFGAAIVAIALVGGYEIGQQTIIPEETAEPPAHVAATNTAMFGTDFSIDYADEIEQGLSYASALAKYRDVRTQLNDSCQPLPSSQTFKSGTVIMLDNRGSKTHIVSLGGVPYRVPALKFLILKLSAVGQSRKLRLDCDKRLNIGTYLVQP